MIKVKGLYDVCLVVIGIFGILIAYRLAGGV